MVIVWTLEGVHGLSRDGTPSHQQMDPPSPRTMFFIEKIFDLKTGFVGRKTRACLFHSAVFERVNVPVRQISAQRLFQSAVLNIVPAYPTQDLPQQGMFETCRTPVDVRAYWSRDYHVTGTRAPLH